MKPVSAQEYRETLVQLDWSDRFFNSPEIAQCNVGQPESILTAAQRFRKRTKCPRKADSLAKDFQGRL
jgi:hypothetical protein